MTIEELYASFGIKKDPSRQVIMPLFPKIMLPYEKISPEFEEIDNPLDTWSDLDKVTSSGMHSFQVNGLPAVIYERRHTNDRKKGELGYYPYTYHMFYCPHLQHHYPSVEEVRKCFNVTSQRDGILDVFVGNSTDKKTVRHTFCRDCYDMLGEIVGKSLLSKYCGSRYDFSLEDFCNAVTQNVFPPVKGIEDFDRFRTYRNKDIYYEEQFWHEYAYLRKVAADFTCERCGKICKDENGEYIPKSLQVHHIDRNPLNMNPKDHIVLCVACHEKEHEYKKYEDVE